MPRSWSYGCDELIDEYRTNESEASAADARRLRKVIRECLSRVGRGSPARFLDKSQVYTLKARYIQELLREHDPIFVLITRNPYATCLRAAQGKAPDMRRYASFLSLDERFELCVQHWSNCMRTILADARHLRNFTWLRYEDFLTQPEEKTRQFCDFVGLEFEPSMLPAPQQSIPFGTKFHERWYPLKPEVNGRYLRALSKAQIQTISSHCGDIAEQFGYSAPVNE
jgi:hypothetical protein